MTQDEQRYMDATKTLNNSQNIMEQQTNFLFNKGSINCDQDSNLIRTMMFEDQNKVNFHEAHIDHVGSDNSEDLYGLARVINDTKATKTAESRNRTPNIHYLLNGYQNEPNVNSVSHMQNEGGDPSTPPESSQVAQAPLLNSNESSNMNQAEKNTNENESANLTADGMLAARNNGQTKITGTPTEQ